MNATLSPFAAHSLVVPLSGIIAPRPVTVPVRKLGFDPADRASLDAFADRMLAEERQRNLDAVAEQQTEARSWPSRINKDND